jgi:hypothetical protein
MGPAAPGESTHAPLVTHLVLSVGLPPERCELSANCVMFLVTPSSGSRSVSIESGSVAA